MRYLLIGWTVAGMIAFLPTTEAWAPGRSGRHLQGPPQGQMGLASWYGAHHQGKPTASGEFFDMHGLTAAHRTLPLGTTVRVTNLTNFKSTILRVTDRGPAPPKRIIDVSWAAAKVLGFVNAGLTRVWVEVIQYPQEHRHPAGELMPGAPEYSAGAQLSELDASGPRHQTKP